MLGVLFLLAFGLARLPVESRVTASLREAGLKDPPPDVSWNENFSQMFISTLGGLRGAVASTTYLLAYSAFERMDWGAVDNRMTLVTRMEPREALYWDQAAWHMAYNAASSFKRNKELRAAIQNKLFRDYVQRGIDILHMGLHYLPEHHRLLTTLGDIYRDRQPNPEMAADCYLRAYQNGARPFIERMAAYEMVKTNNPKLAPQAYEILKRYYDMGASYWKRQRLVNDLKTLEERLNIPAEKRIHPPPETTAPPRPGPRLKPPPQ